MQYTLLELTQAILSSMDSDEITSIDDTVEAQQVVSIIKGVYDDIISRGDIVATKTLFTMTESTDVTKPVLMTKPTSIDRIDWIKYNRVAFGQTDPEWAELSYMPVDRFLAMVQGFSPTESNVDTFTYSANGFNFVFHYKTDVGPNFYTSFDDATIICDSYDVAVDTKLKATKTIAYGPMSTVFANEDDFVPLLQPHQFPLLLNEAKSLAWSELKQASHPKAEQSARRNWRHLARTRQNIPTNKFQNTSSPFDQFQYFGRK